MVPPLLDLIGEPVFRRFWYPVATAASVADAPVPVRLLGEDLVLWRVGAGSVAAAVDRCPHRYARLSVGWLGECGIVCPYHGWEFGDDGAAVHVPQLDAGATIPPRARLSSVACQERYGWVWLCLGEPLLPIPDLPEHGASGWRTIVEPASTWRCPAPVVIENNLDPAHIAFVHRASFGSPEVPHVPVADADRTPTGLRTAYEVPVQSRPGEDRPTVRSTTTDVYGPLLMFLRVDYPDGVSHLMVKACTPVDATTTLQLQQVLRSDGEAERPGADIVAFDAQVWDEDRAVLETAHHDYPLDLTLQVHLKIDRPTIEYRRLLADLVRTGALARPADQAGANASSVASTSPSG